MSMSVTSRWAPVGGVIAASLMCGQLFAAPLDEFWDATNRRGFQWGVLDMYQHQNRGAVNDTQWEDTGGWCRPTAYLDALWGWKLAGFNTLPDAVLDNNAWLNSASASLKTMSRDFWFKAPAPGTSSPHGTGRLERWLHNRPGSIGIAAGVGKGLMEVEIIDDGSGRLKYSSWALTGDAMLRNVPGAGGTQPILHAAQDAFIKNRSVVATIEVAPAYQAAAAAEGLWWAGGSYHTITLAGIDIPNNKIYFADPDSNHGNAGTDSGITGGFPGPATDPIVQAKRFKPSDPIPVAARIPGQPSATPTGVGAYYREVTVDPGTGQFLLNAVLNERYRFPDITSYNTIERIKAAPRALPQPLSVGSAGLSGDGFFNSTQFNYSYEWDITAGMVEAVDAFWFFPNSAFDPGSFSFTATGGTWQLKSVLGPDEPDPFGNTWPFGGVMFSLMSGLPLLPGGKSEDNPSPPGLLTFRSESLVTAWDTYFHDASDPLGLDADPMLQIWDVQSVGGVMMDFPPHVPEPGLLSALLGAGLLLRRSRPRPAGN